MNVKKTKSSKKIVLKITMSMTARGSVVVVTTVFNIEITTGFSIAIRAAELVHGVIAAGILIKKLVPQAKSLAQAGSL